MLNFPDYTATCYFITLCIFACRTVGVSAYFLCAYVKMNFSMFSYGMENIALLVYLLTENMHDKPKRYHLFHISEHSFSPLAQVERVSHRENLHSFILKSENLEKQCLAKAIKSYCELRVLPYGENKTVVFWGEVDDNLKFKGTIGMYVWLWFQIAQFKFSHVELLA